MQRHAAVILLPKGYLGDEQKNNAPVIWERVDAAQRLVGAGGFEPPKLKSNRFTVCPIWPLWNAPIYSILK